MYINYSTVPQCECPLCVTRVWRPLSDTRREESSRATCVYHLSPFCTNHQLNYAYIKVFICTADFSHGRKRQVPVARVQQLDLFVGVGRRRSEPLYTL